jgi:phosphatidate cytidylyltransferase
LNIFFRRTLTGAWIVILVLGGFWLHPFLFFLTGLVILTGTMNEYYTMIKNTGVRPQVIPGIFTGIAGYTISSLIAAEVLPPDWFLVLIPVMLIIMVSELYRKQSRPFDALAHTFLGILYIALPFSMFPFAAFSKSGLASLIPHQSIDFSPGIIIGFFILLWAHDTGAYLSGISFGRHKLMERISPGKTWEGCFGGFFASAIIALLLSGWLGGVSTFHWIAIAAVISLAGTYGDLVESMLKRSLNVKDSGTLMPGHGGFLDRFDSTLISFPLVYLFILVFG